MTTIPLNNIPDTPELSAPGREVAEARVRRRLLPLYISSWVLGITLWAPVEKLFLKHIGFTAGTIGLLAATYAAVVPFLEVPSGILADRWSRRGVLMIANGALGASALVGGLSTNVPMYLVSALLLGVYFALHSGTVDSIVYDLVVEETGTSDGFERFLGRLRVGESAAFVVSAFAGGAIAQVWGPRVTYFLTVPFVIASIIVVASLREPRLHRSRDAEPLRAQVATTYRTFVDARQLRPVILALVATGVLLQSLVEFGPLWMVVLGAPAVLFGPQWASLMSAQGLGGWLAGRMPFQQSSMVVAALAMVPSSVVLATSDNAVAIIAAQVVLATALVAISTVVMRRLHDEIPSSHRAGISSGVGTLTWMAFLPCSLTFGFLAQKAGIHVAALLVVAIVVLMSGTVVRLAGMPPGHTGDASNREQCVRRDHGPAAATTAS